MGTSGPFAFCIVVCQHFEHSFEKILCGPMFYGMNFKTQDVHLAGTTENMSISLIEPLENVYPDTHKTTHFGFDTGDYGFGRGESAMVMFSGTALSSIATVMFSIANGQIEGLGPDWLPESINIEGFDEKLYRQYLEDLLIPKNAIRSKPPAKVSCKHRFGPKDWVAPGDQVFLRANYDNYDCQILKRRTRL